jgi:hypothetical protein
MRWTIFFLLCVVVFGCKKDEDTTPPTVVIQQPVDGLLVNVLDEVHIVVNVADDVELADVEVRLVDVNQIAAMPAALISTSGTGGTMQFNYLIDDVTLSSGQYYIQVTVHDAARNQSKDFAMIYLTAVPRVLKGLFAVTTVPGTVTLHALDTAWTPGVYGTYAGDFTDMAVSNWWQQVGFSGAYTGMFRSISIDGAHPGWTANAFPTTGPYWGNVSTHGRDWLVNYRADGLLKTLTWNGTIAESNTANNGYFFRNFVYSGDKLFADMIDVTGTSRLMGIYEGSGGATQQAPMNLDPVVLLPRDENTIYAVGNWNGQGKLLIYDYNMNGFWEPIALPAGQVLSATEVDAGTLLIAMDNGTIYKFTYSPIGLLTWHSATAQHLRYDDAGGTLITVEGTSVKQYNYPLTNVLEQAILPDTAADIELWYNR